PSRFTEDFILYFRDLLLYKTAPNLDEIAEQALIDEEFKTLAEEIQPQQIYEYIDIVSKTQQEMRFSNHARIYLEVCLVKLCQTERIPAQADGPQLQELYKKIEALEKEIKWLKNNSQPNDKTQSKPAAPSKRPARNS